MKSSNMAKKEKGEPMDNGQLVNDACSIIEQARKFAYHSVNETLVKRNWLLGMPKIFQSVIGKSVQGAFDVVPVRPILLAWTHYSILLQEKW